MHPDLLNNSHFLRYHNQWQENPTSILFAPIAEYLMSYDLLDDALKICLAGLVHHPKLVSGRLVLAKVYCRQKNWEEMKKQIDTVFSLMPNHEQAMALLQQMEESAVPEPPVISAPEIAPKKKVASWETVTMAKIYAAQGHLERATEVYQNILSREPHNEEAKRGLSELQNQHR